MYLDETQKVSRAPYAGLALNVAAGLKTVTQPQLRLLNLFHCANCLGTDLGQDPKSYSAQGFVCI